MFYGIMWFDVSGVGLDRIYWLEGRAAEGGRGERGGSGRALLARERTARRSAARLREEGSARPRQGEASGSHARGTGRVCVCVRARRLPPPPHTRGFLIGEGSGATVPRKPRRPDRNPERGVRTGKRGGGVAGGTAPHRSGGRQGDCWGRGTGHRAKPAATRAALPDGTQTQPGRRSFLEGRCHLKGAEERAGLPPGGRERQAGRWGPAPPPHNGAFVAAALPDSGVGRSQLARWRRLEPASAPSWLERAWIRHHVNLHINWGGGLNM